MLLLGPCSPLWVLLLVHGGKVEDRDVGVKLVSGGMGEREVERPVPAL